MPAEMQYVTEGGRAAATAQPARLPNYGRV
jgi:hypothetical protein